MTAFWPGERVRVDAPADGYADRPTSGLGTFQAWQQAHGRTYARIQMDNGTLALVLPAFVRTNYTPPWTPAPGQPADSPVRKVHRFDQADTTEPILTEMALAALYAAPLDAEAITRRNAALRRCAALLGAQGLPRSQRKLTQYAAYWQWQQETDNGGQ